MTRINWGNENPSYENGLDRGVLYLDEGSVPWNGLVSAVTKNAEDIGGDQFFDGNKFRITQGVSAYSATIEAITYPQAMEKYEGLDTFYDNQPHKSFGFSYRTQSGPEHYQIHIVYNVIARATPIRYQTDTDKQNPSNFLWDFYTVTDEIPGSRKGSYLIVDTADAPYSGPVETLEGWLYGTSSTAPYLPTKEQIEALFETPTIFEIVYNGDGTFTATGPDDWFVINGDDFAITTPSGYYLDDDTYLIRSY